MPGAMVPGLLLLGTILENNRRSFGKLYAKLILPITLLARHEWCRNDHFVYR